MNDKRYIFTIRRMLIVFNVLRESVSKLVCDWVGLWGLGGEEVHDDSIKKIKKENKKHFFHGQFKRFTFLKNDLTFTFTATHLCTFHAKRKGSKGNDLFLLFKKKESNTTKRLLTRFSIKLQRIRNKSSKGKLKQKKNSCKILKIT